MKLITLIVSILISTTVWAQSAITITSNNKDIRFVLVVENQQLNDFYETYVQIQNIPAGYHEVKVVFEGDSIADYFKNILVKNGQEKTFLVVAKGDVKKSVNKAGRDVGEVAKIGDHDEDFKYLQDVYQLDLDSKESFTPTGSEMIISTEKTLSTSIMPATKSKH